MTTVNDHIQRNLPACKQGAVHEMRLRHNCCERLELIMSNAGDCTAYIVALERVARLGERWRNPRELVERTELIDALDALEAARPHQSAKR